ncbi:MAG TPA: Hsp20 family protein [Candidatus Lokiarchaeia archaeon]|nr:Hsp20 family protein [Candidatus Lokiarchaeia archaeon]
MAIVQSPPKGLKGQTPGENPLYHVTPNYSAWMAGNEFVIQVAIPGVARENIKMKALRDLFYLRAERDNIEYALDLDLNFEIDPNQVTAKYEEGLLRVAFERLNPLDEAYNVPIN